MNFSPDSRPVHFIGIGGTGMCPQAVILKRMGFNVRGSDIKDSKDLIKLREMGIDARVGHRAENVDGCQGVVYSTAIPLENPEMARARELALPIVKRGELLADLFNLRRGIAIAGTHGKTTTTTMLARIFEDAGLDPVFLVGANLDRERGGSAIGEGEHFIAEADESDNSFLLLKPVVNIVTNVERDHLDFHKSFGGIRNAFYDFIQNTDPNGRLIYWAEDPVLPELVRMAPCPTASFGLTDAADYRALKIDYGREATSFTLRTPDGAEHVVRLAGPGEHNLLNALAALVAADGEGIDIAQAAKTLSIVQGPRRRFEILHEDDKLTLVDDYAHHPTEIRATLAACHQRFNKKITAVFQPHRYSRLATLYEDFLKCFDDADAIWLTDIYAAGEEPIKGISAALLYDDLKARYPDKEVKFFPELDVIRKYVEENGLEPMVLITLGAGNVNRLVKELRDRRRKD